MMMTEPTLSELLGTFEATTAALQMAMGQDHVEDTIAAALATFTGPQTRKGVDFTPDDVRDDVERMERTDYDRALREAGARLDAVERILEQQIKAELTVAEELPRCPEILQNKNDSIKLLAELREGQARQEAREQLRGRSLKEVAERYRATTDAADPEFVRLVESGRGDSFAELGLREDDPQVQIRALMAIQKAVTDRRRARSEAAALEAVAVRARLRPLQRTATLDVLRRHVRSGRGVALRPYRRQVIVGRPGAQASA